MGPQPANDFGQTPWTFPVPIKTSSFVALKGQHQACNVEVDLSSIGAFSNESRARAANQLLFADLQTCADVNVGRRLGSGRSGYLRGHYLKGIGRTPLAGNWNDPEDMYHNSGLQFASAAVREYLVSRLLRARGKIDLVHPCEGLLMRPVPPSATDHPVRVFKHLVKGRRLDRTRYPPIDFSLQAITVKKGNFARLTNLVWWLNNFPQMLPENESPFAVFFRLLYRAVGGESSEDGDVGPAEIAEALSTASVRVLTNILGAWASGIDWVSFHNNFAADGRFVDLETPLVLPHATLGLALPEMPGAKKHPAQFSQGPSSFMMGFNVIWAAAELRKTLDLICDRLSFFLRNKMCNLRERPFVAEVQHSLERCLRRHHPLRSHEAFTDLVMSTISSTLNLGRFERELLEAHLGYLARDLMTTSAGKPPKALAMVQLEMPKLARCEPLIDRTIYVPAFLRDVRLPAVPLNLKFNELVLEVERMTNLNDVFNLLKRA